jgi:hypothetical protein
MALEEACFEITRRRRLAAGESHAALEADLGATTTTVTKLALALFDDADRGGDVYGWLNRRIGSWATNTVKAVNKGAHESVPDVRGLVGDCGRLIRGLRETLG